MNIDHCTNYNFGENSQQFGIIELGWHPCTCHVYGVSWPSGYSALDSSSGVVRMWPVGSVCCVMHVKEHRTLIVKEKGLSPVFLDSRLEHPALWIIMCTLQMFCIIIIL